MSHWVCPSCDTDHWPGDSYSTYTCYCSPYPGTPCVECDCDDMRHAEIAVELGYDLTDSERSDP